MSSIPAELVQAFCFQLEGQWFLVKGIDAQTLARLGEGAFSPVWVRYAFRQLGTYQPFFPTVGVDDRGKLHRDLELVDWLAGQGLLYPRADVDGLLFTGQPEQFVLKELDLGLSMLAFAVTGEADFPGRLLTAAVELVADVRFALAPGGNYPIRLASTIPVLQLNAAVPLAKAIQLIPQVAADPRMVDLDVINS
jgi:hypothetical protein